MRRAFVGILVVTTVMAAVTSTVDARYKGPAAQTHLGPITWQRSGTGGPVTLIEATITSTKSKCLAGRKIDIQTGPSETLQSPFGSGTTDAGGHFSISGSTTNDYYSVYVAKVKVGKLLCRTTAAYGRFSAGTP
jgi:hypothetical protein